MADNPYARRAFQEMMRFYAENQPQKYKEITALLDRKTGQAHLGQNAQPDVFSLDYWSQLGSRAIDSVIQYEMAKEQAEYESEIAKEKMQAELARQQRQAELAAQEARTNEMRREAEKARQELQELRERAERFGSAAFRGFGAVGLLIGLFLVYQAVK